MASDSLISEQRNPGPFSGIHLSGIGHVFLTQGETHQVEVKAPPAVLQKVKTEIKGDILEIGYKFAPFRWLRSAGDLNEIEFHITSPTINSIISSGAGTIKGMNLISVKDLDLESNGVGNTEIEVDAGSIITKITGAGNIFIQGKVGAQDITVTGAGKYEGFDLNSNTTIVKSTGSGQCFISVSEKLEVKITGVGKVKYKGTPKIESRITGLGKLESGN